MKRQQEQRIDDYEVTLIHKAFLAYSNVLKSLQNGFTLGDFAKKARKQFGMRDEIGREIYKALRNNKDEVVVLA